MTAPGGARAPSDLPFEHGRSSAGDESTGKGSPGHDVASVLVEVRWRGA